MSEEIKFIDNEKQVIESDNNKSFKEESQINTPTEMFEEKPSKESKKVSLPTWNIEPPIEIQRNIK